MKRPLIYFVNHWHGPGLLTTGTAGGKQHLGCLNLAPSQHAQHAAFALTYFMQFFFTFHNLSTLFNEYLFFVKDLFKNMLISRLL